MSSTAFLVSAALPRSREDNRDPLAGLREGRTSGKVSERHHGNATGFRVFSSRGKQRLLDSRTYGIADEIH